MLRPRSFAAVAGGFALLCCACPRREPVQPAPAEDACPVPSTAACRPFVVATGEALDAPPGAWLSPRQGLPLAVTAVEEGRFEVGVPASCSYRGFVSGPAADVLFAEATELETGVVASPGARARLYFENEGIAIAASNGHRYDVPCSALAVNDLAAPTPPTHAASMYVVEDQTLLSIYGDPLLELPVADTWRVDVLEERGEQAKVRAWLDGFEYTGLVSLNALAAEQPEAGGLSGSNADDVVPEPLSFELGASCEGTATLRAGAAPATGPRVRFNREQTEGRALPALTRDIQVRVRRTAGDDRLVEISDPSPEIARLVAWVKVDDLDADPCTSSAAAQL